MAKCFLSYSYGYRHVMEAVRGLLKALDFEGVDVVDEPDDQRPPHNIVKQRIQDADCVLVLYGPPSRPEKDIKESDAAKWPYEEAVFAHGMQKPISLIVHAGTVLPELLKDYQSPARFNFWDPQSFFENVHHVVKHLMDFKRRVDLPIGHQPYRFQKIDYRYRISKSGTLSHDCYHEVVVSQQRNAFHHAIDTGSSEAAEAILEALRDQSYELEAGAGADWHSVTLEKVKCDEREFEYLVRIHPPLYPGEVFGYRRSFDIPNWLPLTQSEVQSSLSIQSKRDDFPRSLFENRFFGVNFDVPYDAESLTMAIHFPKRVKIKSHRVTVVEYLNRLSQNPSETQRCNSKEFLRLIEETGSPERVLELIVPRPLFNHSYYLLYEPAD